MTEVHLIPDERTTWRVYGPDAKAPLSQHASATEAELAAQAHAQDRDADRVVVHDRYNRTHEAAPTPAGVSAGQQRARARKLASSAKARTGWSVAARDCNRPPAGCTFKRSPVEASGDKFRRRTLAADEMRASTGARSAPASRPHLWERGS